MKTRRLVVDGVGVACHQREGNGAPIVLLHGNSCSARCFERQFADLRSDLALTAIDLPGHGASGDALDPDATYTVPGYARVVREAVVKLGLERAVFVGWSLGGHVVLEAAEAWPQAAGFMIIATPPIGDPETLADAFLPHPALASLYRAESTDADFAAWAGAFFGRDAAELSHVVEHFRRADGRARAALGASIRPGGFRDEREVVNGLKQPLAIVLGEHDPLINLQYLINVDAPSLWRGEVQIVAGSGHAPHWEEPGAFNRLLSAFVDECAALRKAGGDAGFTF